MIAPVIARAQNRFVSAFKNLPTKHFDERPKCVEQKYTYFLLFIIFIQLFAMIASALVTCSFCLMAAAAPLARLVIIGICSAVKSVMPLASSSFTLRWKSNNEMTNVETRAGRLRT